MNTDPPSRYPEEERKKGGAAFWLLAKESLRSLASVCWSITPITLAIGVSALSAPSVRRAVLSEIHALTGLGAPPAREGVAAVSRRAAKASTGPAQAAPADSPAPGAQTVAGPSTGAEVGGTGPSSAAAQNGAPGAQAAASHPGVSQSVGAGPSSNSNGAQNGAAPGPVLASAFPGGQASPSSVSASIAAPRPGFAAQKNASSQASSGRASAWQSGNARALGSSFGIASNFGGAFNAKLGANRGGLGRGFGGAAGGSGGAGRSGAAGASGSARPPGASGTRYSDGSPGSISRMDSGDSLGGGGAHETKAAIPADAIARLIHADNTMVPGARGDMTAAAHLESQIYDNNGNRKALGGGRVRGDTSPVLTYVDSQGPLDVSPDGTGAPPGTAVPPKAAAKNATPWQKEIDLAQKLIAIASKLISISSLLVWAGKQLVHTAWGATAGAALIAAGEYMAWSAAALAGAATMLGLTILVGYRQKLQGAIITVSAAALMISAIRAAEGDRGAHAAAEDKIHGVALTKGSEIAAALAPNNIAALQTGLGLALGNSPAGQLIGGAFGLYNGISGLMAGGGALNMFQAGVGLAQTVVGIVKPGGQAGQILSTALTGISAGLSMASPIGEYHSQLGPDGQPLNPASAAPASPTITVDGAPLPKAAPSSLPADQVAVTGNENGPTVVKPSGTQPPGSFTLDGIPFSPVNYSALGLAPGETTVQGDPAVQTVMPPGFVGPLAPGQVYSPSDQVNADANNTADQTTPAPRLPPPAAGDLSPSMSDSRMASRYIGTASVTDGDGNTVVLARLPGKYDGYDVLNTDGSPVIGDNGRALHYSNSAGADVLNNPDNLVTGTNFVQKHNDAVVAANAAADNLCGVGNCVATVDPNGTVSIQPKYAPPAAPSSDTVATAPAARPPVAPSAQLPTDPNENFVSYAFDYWKNKIDSVGQIISNSHTQIGDNTVADMMEGGVSGNAKVYLVDMPMEVVNNLGGKIFGTLGAVADAGHAWTTPGGASQLVQFAKDNPVEVTQAVVESLPPVQFGKGVYQMTEQLTGPEPFNTQKFFQGMENAGTGALFTLMGGTGKPTAPLEGKLPEVAPGAMEAAPTEVAGGPKVVPDAPPVTPAAVEVAGGPKIVTDAPPVAPVPVEAVGGAKPLVASEVPPPAELVPREAAGSVDGAKPLVAGDGAPPEVKVPGTGDGAPPAVTGDGAKPGVTGDGAKPAVTGDGGPPANPAGEAPARGYVNQVKGANGEVVAAPGDVKILSSEVLQVGGRDIIVVETESGPQAFYRTSGVNSAQPGGSIAPGDWLPYKGNAELNVPGRPVGWFDKADFSPEAAADDPLRRFGNYDNVNISHSLGEMDIPEGRPVSIQAANDALLKQDPNLLSDYVRQSIEVARGLPEGSLKPPVDPPVAGAVSAETPVPSGAPESVPVAKPAPAGEAPGAIDPARIDAAKEVLPNTELTPPKQQGVMDAHNVGTDNVLADGSHADAAGNLRPDPTKGPELGNYTSAEIAQKARILRDAGFTPEETRALMENGVTGNAVEPTLSKTWTNPRTGVEVKTYDFGNGASAKLVEYPDHMQILPDGIGRGAEMYDFAIKQAGENGLPLWSDELYNLSPGSSSRWLKLVDQGRAYLDPALNRYVVAPDAPSPLMDSVPGKTVESVPGDSMELDFTQKAPSGPAAKSPVVSGVKDPASLAADQALIAKNPNGISADGKFLPDLGYESKYLGKNVDTLYTGQKPEIVSDLLDHQALLTKAAKDGMSLQDAGGLADAVENHVVGGDTRFFISTTEKASTAFDDFGDTKGYVIEIRPQQTRFFSTESVSEEGLGSGTAGHEAEYLAFGEVPINEIPTIHSTISGRAFDLSDPVQVQALRDELAWAKDITARNGGTLDTNTLRTLWKRQGS